MNKALVGLALSILTANGAANAAPPNRRTNLGAFKAEVFDRVHAFIDGVAAGRAPLTLPNPRPSPVAVPETIDVSSARVREALRVEAARLPAVNERDYPTYDAHRDAVARNDRQFDLLAQTVFARAGLD